MKDSIISERIRLTIRIAKKSKHESKIQQIKKKEKKRKKIKTSNIWKNNKTSTETQTQIHSQRIQSNKTLGPLQHDLQA